jgi:hypothetical protein
VPPGTSTPWPRSRDGGDDHRRAAGCALRPDPQSTERIDDIWSAASSADYDTADRLGREYSDELRLVADDLGWGDGPGGRQIELTTDPDLLRRVFGRLRDSAAGERAAQATSWAENRILEDRNRLVDEACTTVLEALDGAE